MAGTASGVASASATLTGTGILAAHGASSAGTSSATGTILGDGALAASSAGIASGTATLLGAGILAGQSNGVATVSGTADTPAGRIAGIASGTSTPSATLLGDGALAGTAAGTSTATLDSGVTTIAVGGGGVWHGWKIGIGPYKLPPTQDPNITPSFGWMEGTAKGISFATGTLRADFVDITDEELLLILAAVLDDNEGDFTLEIAS